MYHTAPFLVLLLDSIVILMKYLQKHMPQIIDSLILLCFWQKRIWKRDKVS